MAMPPEFTRFKNEEDFTDNFLVPLHQRLGFTTVCNFHGTTELGKDLVFAEVDRFTDILFHGLQAKFVPSISLAAVEELIADAKQAFNNEFTHPQTGSRERISRFIAVNGGSISDQARTHFFNSLTPIYGGNVKLLDGKALLALDRGASSQSGGFVKEKLTGLILELRFNNNICERITPNLQAFLKGEGNPPLAKLKVASVNSFLSQPVVLGAKMLDELLKYWDYCTIVDRCLDLLTTPESAKEYRIHNGNRIQELMPLMKELAIAIEKECLDKLAEVGITSVFDCE